MLLCTLLHPFICVSHNVSVLICPVYVVSGQDNELLAVQLLTEVPAVVWHSLQMLSHSQLVEILVFLSIQMLYQFFNSLLILCYSSSPIVPRAIQTRKVEEKKKKKHP